MKTLRRFTSYYKPHLKLFILDMAASLLMALCGLVYPQLTRDMINRYIPDENIKMVAILAAVVLGIYLFKAYLNYFVQYYGHVVATRMQGDMRRDLFDHYQKLPIDYFDNNKTGALMSRLSSDLMDVCELAHHGPEELFLSAVMLIGSFVLMSQIDIYLTLIVFACIPVLFAFAMKKRLKMGREFKELRVQNAIMNASIENSLSGIRVSKAYVADGYENDKFYGVVDDFVKRRGHALKVMAEFNTGSVLISDILKIVVLISGTVFKIMGRIDFGDLAAFILYENVFMSPINMMISFIEQFQNGMSGFTRFCEIMDTPVEKDLPGAVKLENVKGEIDFCDVSFAYSDSKEILSHITFNIKAGRTLALVGPSGGGKSTICNIIPRFYDVTSGEVKIDGVNIKNYTLKSLRANIGIVSQDVFLFDTTLFENIAYGNKDASMDDVVAAAKRANIHDYVMSLPDGYDTLVGERGIKLSGGQKQRVAIARVFLKNPPVLILDEATSALDNTTEKLITESLAELAKGRTVIVVAHRLSTVKNADEIIVITDEGIRERGTHSELLKANGLYTELYEYQFRQD